MKKQTHRKKGSCAVPAKAHNQDAPEILPSLHRFRRGLLELAYLVAREAVREAGKGVKQRRSVSAPRFCSLTLLALGENSWKIKVYSVRFCLSLSRI